MCDSRPVACLEGGGVLLPDTWTLLIIIGGETHCANITDNKKPVLCITPSYNYNNYYSSQEELIKN